MTRSEPRDPIGVLRTLGQHYRHLHQAHAHESPGSAARRRVDKQLRDLRGQFERVVERWVRGDDLRAAWMRYLHGDGPAPDRPGVAAPLLFKGITDAGSVVELHETTDGGYDVVVDGNVSRHELVRWRQEPDRIEPITVGEYTCREIFDAPPEAVRALGEFLAGAPPPWPWARALYEDGLVTANLEITSRGRRRIAIQPGGEPEVGRRYGVLVVDSTRARVFVLETLPGEIRQTVSPLAEIAAVTNPERRARDREVFTETRPGVRREGPQTPQGGADDRRAASRRETDRRFVEVVLDEARRAWRALFVTRVIIVASPATLGLIRPLLARRNGGPRAFEIQDYTRELTQLGPAAVHDALSAAGLLPARGRRSFGRSPPPGVPISR